MTTKVGLFSKGANKDGVHGDEDVGGVCGICGVCGVCGAI